MNFTLMHYFSRILIADNGDKKGKLCINCFSLANFGQ